MTGVINLKNDQRVRARFTRKIGRMGNSLGVSKAKILRPGNSVTIFGEEKGDMSDR
jgi:hypothetical protein